MPFGHYSSQEDYSIFRTPTSREWFATIPAMIWRAWGNTGVAYELRLCIHGTKGSCWGKEPNNWRFSRCWFSCKDLCPGRGTPFRIHLWAIRARVARMNSVLITRSMHHQGGQRQWCAFCDTWSSTVYSQDALPYFPPNITYKYLNFLCLPRSLYLLIKALLDIFKSDVLTHPSTSINYNPEL